MCHPGHSTLTQAPSCRNQCLISATSGHSATVLVCSVKFPTIQKNNNHLVLSEHDTTSHEYCLCWWKKNVPEPWESLSVVDFPYPVLMEPLMTGLSDSDPNHPNERLWGNCITAGDSKALKAIETCAVHQQQVVIFPKEPHLTLFPLRPPPPAWWYVDKCSRISGRL